MNTCRLCSNYAGFRGNGMIINGRKRIMHVSGNYVKSLGRLPIIGH